MPAVFDWIGCLPGVPDLPARPAAEWSLCDRQVRGASGLPVFPPSFFSCLLNSRLSFCLVSLAFSTLVFPSVLFLLPSQLSSSLLPVSSLASQLLTLVFPSSFPSCFSCSLNSCLSFTYFSFVFCSSVLSLFLLSLASLLCSLRCPPEF